MAILQISKIQQRSGNLVDLPQLDDAEFGWATDTKRLFIGKSTPNENIEVLTSYSQINFSQINGSVGNLNISNINIADGQVLAYDGSEWVNKGGDAGGLLTLGDVSNVKIDGGAIGYVLETDGLGNLSWTPKSSITSFFENVTQADPAVVTTTQDNFFTQGASITVTNVPGMTQLNGNVYYVDILTSNTFALYHDSGLANTVDSTGYSTFPYATVSATDTLTDQITVSDATPFTINDPVVFTGDLGNSTIVVGQTYYVKTKDTSAPNTWITISSTAGGNTFDPGTEASPSGAEVYVPGGRAVSLVSGGTTSLAAAGSPTQIQYNDTNLLQGNADFTYNNSTKLLTLNGNANVGNLNATGVSTATRFISNVANGTPPLQVTSITQVANLNVATSGSVVNGNSNVNIPAANGNVNISAVGNANILVVTGTGANITGTLNATGNANVGNLGTTTAIITTGNITTINSGLLQNGNSNVTLTANANVSVFVAGNATARAVFTSTGANIAGTANITGNANVGNLGTAGLITATGNVSGGNLTTAGALAVTGNANVGNLGTAGLVVATGNVTGGNLTTGGVVAATGNVTGGNLTTAGVVAATGNVSGGNLTTAGVVAATGNVSGGNLTTAGALSVTGNANVGNIGSVAGVFTGNVTAGNLYANSGTLGVATLNVSGVSNLNAVGNVRISGGNANQILKTDGAGNLSWTDPNGGYYLHTQVSASSTWTVTHNLNRQYVTVEPIDSSGNSYTGRYDYPTISYTNANAFTMTFTSAVAGYAAVTGGGTNINSVSVGNSTPGGVNTQVQFNDAGALAGSSGLVYNKTTGTLTATLYVGSGANLTSIAGANVTGAVAFATTANAVAGANVSGAVAFATTANAVAGANVSGTVPNANNSAFLGGTAAASYLLVTGTGSSLTALTGANVTGAVAFATTANAVAGANVSGTVSQATTVMGATQNNITTLGALTTLSSGANTTAGTITGNWSLSSGSRLTATYADLAEYYEADVKYLPGTVLMFGGEKEVTLAEDGTNKVAGVVSTNPAYVMNATCPGLLTAVALQGRVPCKVRGKISKGDMLISGGNGFARPNQFPAMGTVIGKALQDFDGYEGVIEVAVGRL